MNQSLRAMLCTRMRCIVDREKVGNSLCAARDILRQDYPKIHTNYRIITITTITTRFLEIVAGTPCGDTRRVRPLDISPILVVQHRSARHAAGESKHDNACVDWDYGQMNPSTIQGWSHSEHVAV